MGSVEEDAYRYAVKNAFEHGGKADLGAVVGKAKALHPEIDLKKAMPEIIDAVKKANSLGKAELEKEYEKFSGAGFELKPKAKKEGLPDLEWAANEKVVTRYAPNPNGPFHLGNARAAFFSWAFADKYDGTFFLRFEDTDPKVKKSMENAESLFREDLDWLGCPPDNVFWASDRMELYHTKMIELINMGKAYACQCESEEWRGLITKGKGCPCRSKSAEETMALFNKMMSNELKEGQAVLRIKTDLAHPDPSVRDWWIAKVVDRPEHPRVGSKYNVWPSFMFQNAIDDHEMGVTLILRGQEHAQNVTKQKFLYEYFGWTYPHATHFGRIKLGDLVLSTSKIKAGIDKGDYTGWDDPRLGTIRALRRRGFTANALIDALMEVGVKTNDAAIDMKKLADSNRKLIEGEAKRTAFLMDPVQLSVSYAKSMAIEKDGVRYALSGGQQEFLVSKKEADKLKEGSVFRLREAYNARITAKSDYAVSAEFTGTTMTPGKPVLDWLVDGIDIDVVMPDNSKVRGAADPKAGKAKEGDYLHLDRFGFCVVDTVEAGKRVLWFTHK